jgi:hypothetical protein
MTFYEVKKSCSDRCHNDYAWWTGNGVEGSDCYTLLELSRNFPRETPRQNELRPRFHEYQGGVLTMRSAWRCWVRKKSLNPRALRDTFTKCLIKEDLNLLTENSLIYIVFCYNILVISSFILRAVMAQSVYRWATGWMIGVLGFESRQGLGSFLFTTASRTALGPTQPTNQWLPGALSLAVKRPGREAHHSPPSSTDVKNAWSYTSTPQ